MREHKIVCSVLACLLVVGLVTLAAQAAYTNDRILQPGEISVLLGGADGDTVCINTCENQGTDVYCGQGYLGYSCNDSGDLGWVCDYPPEEDPVTKYRELFGVVQNCATMGTSATCDVAENGEGYYAYCWQKHMCICEYDNGYVCQNTTSLMTDFERIAANPDCE